MPEVEGGGAGCVVDTTGFAMGQLSPAEGRKTQVRRLLQAAGRDCGTAGRDKCLRETAAGKAYMLSQAGGGGGEEEASQPSPEEPWPLWRLDPWVLGCARKCLMGVWRPQKGRTGVSHRQMGEPSSQATFCRATFSAVWGEGTSPLRPP